MFIYTNKGIYLITMLISVVLYISVSFIFYQSDFIIQERDIQFNIQIQEQANSDDEDIIILDNQESINSKEKYKWEIRIPKIHLSAFIAEGTTKEIMDQYVGHFEHTSIVNGNVGLAAHNRGYPVNYFQDLKLLEIGDEIIYETTSEIKRYKVSMIEIIEDTNWEYLKNTQDNRITLITCVEGKPSLRRCIQGIEIVEIWRNEYE